MYSFTATKNANYEIELMSFMHPMVLAVRTDCKQVQSETGCSALAAFSQKLTVQATQGMTYYIVADAPNGKPDDFQITVAETL